MTKPKVVEPKAQPNKQAEAVNEFFRVFKPTVRMQKLVREEFNEFVEAIEDGTSVENELKELCDLLYVIYGLAHQCNAPISRNSKEVDEIVNSIAEHKTKYPNINLPLTVIATAYIELITSNYDFMWIYRLAQGCYAYGKVKGWPLEQAFKRVHDSNMSKLENGKVVYREDGKVLKGKNYKPANLKDLLYDKQVGNKQKGSKGTPSKSPVRRTR